MTAISIDKMIAVVGAGTMGAGIAQVAAQAGHKVLLFDAVDGAAATGIERVGKGLDRLVERDRITADRRDEIVGNLTPAAALAELAPAALVIEAIIEKLDIKQQVFKSLEDICGVDTILATNTSSLSVTAIGAALARPENFVGAHFFNPPPVMKLVEVIRGAATAPAVATTVFDTMAAWGKKPVVAKSTPGFIVNRVARPFYAEALRVYEVGGADIATIDAVMREAGGFRMGPFELMDLIGNDVNLAVTKSVFEAFYWDPRYLPSLIQQDLVDAGRYGRKSGRGYYGYADGAAAPNPVTAVDAPAAKIVLINQVSGPLADLVYAAREAGVDVTEGETGLEGALLIDGVAVRLTDGRSATEVAAADAVDDLVLIDLALDYKEAKRIAVAPADQTSDSALTKVVGFLQALGASVSVIDDVPGMIVMRTVAMLANEGADAVRLHVCDSDAVDVAMVNGLNYPVGPLTWAQRIGLGHIETVLDHLARVYGDGRYRCSPLIRRKVLAGEGF